MAAIHVEYVTEVKHHFGQGGKLRGIVDARTPKSMTIVAYFHTLNFHGTSFRWAQCIAKPKHVIFGVDGLYHVTLGRAVRAQLVSNSALEQWAHFFVSDR